MKKSLNEMTNQEKRQEFGLLNNLKREFSDSKKGVGKSLEEIKRHCEITKQMLIFLESRLNIVPDYTSENAYRISDFDIDPSYQEPFQNLVFDLSAREILVHKESLNPNRPPPIIITSTPVRELVSGKSIVIKNKDGLRQYTIEINKIITKISKLQASKSGPIIGEPTSGSTPFTIAEDRKGYLVISGQKVFLGKINTGKFRVVESLCIPHFGVAKTIDSVFEYLVEKSKRISSQVSEYEKLVKIKDQIKEVNRLITTHGTRHGIKPIKKRVGLEVNGKTIMLIARGR